MTLVASPEVGYKIAKGSGIADNSAGTAAADIGTKITISELKKILDVVSITVMGAKGPYILRSYTVTGNEVSVTVNVPAGDTATVEVVVVGY